MAVWKTDEVARVSLPPEKAPPGGDSQDSQKPDLDEEYIEEQDNLPPSDQEDEGDEQETDNDSNDSDSGQDQSNEDSGSDTQPSSEETDQEEAGEEEGVNDSTDSSAESSDDAEDSSGDDESDESGDNSSGSEQPISGDEEDSSGDDGDSSDSGDDSSDEPADSSAGGDSLPGDEEEGEEELGGGDEPDLEESDVPDLSAEEAEEMRKALIRLQENMRDQQAIARLQEMSKDVQGILNGAAVQNKQSYMVSPLIKDNFYRVEPTPMSTMYARQKLMEGNRDIGNLSVRLRRLFSDRHSQNIQTGLKKGKRLSGKDIHRLHTDRAQGRVPRIWKRQSDGVNQDAAVSIAVDNSSSMQGRRAVMVEKLTMALGTTLQRMRVPFEMMGYTANQRSGFGDGSSGARDYPVDINIIKTFEERSFDIARCVFPEDVCITPDLDCLRVMSPRLLARPEPKKIMFVLTDGQPTTFCYGTGSLQDGLEYSLREHIKDMRKRGVIMFGFGMEADLRTFYGEDFVYVDSGSMSEFPKLVIEKLTKLLMGS